MRKREPRFRAAVGSMALALTFSWAGQAAANPPEEKFSPYIRFPEGEFSRLDPPPASLPLVGIGDNWFWHHLFVLDEHGVGYDITLTLHRTRDRPSPSVPDDLRWLATHMGIIVMPHDPPYGGQVWRGYAEPDPETPRNDCSTVALHWDEYDPSCPEPGCRYFEHYAESIPADPSCPGPRIEPRRMVSLSRLPDEQGRHRYLLEADLDVERDGAKESAHVAFRIEVVMDEGCGNFPLLLGGDGRFFYHYEDLYPLWYGFFLGERETQSFFYEQFGRVVGGSIGMGEIGAEATPVAIRSGLAYGENQPKNAWETAFWLLCAHAGWEQHRISLPTPSGGDFPKMSMDVNFDYVRVPASCASSPDEIYDFNQTQATWTLQMGQQSYDISDLPVLYQHYDGYYCSERDGVPGRFFAAKDFMIATPGGLAWAWSGSGYVWVRVPGIVILTRRILPTESYQRYTAPNAFASVSHTLVQTAAGWEYLQGHVTTEQTRPWVPGMQADPYGDFDPADPPFEECEPSQSSESTGANRKRIQRMLEVLREKIGLTEREIDMLLGKMGGSEEE